MLAFAVSVPMRVVALGAALAVALGCAATRSTRSPARAASRPHANSMSAAPTLSSASAPAAVAATDELLACPSFTDARAQVSTSHLRGDQRICCLGTFSADPRWQSTDARSCLLATAPGLARPAFAITGGTGPVAGVLRSATASSSIERQDAEFGRLVDLLQRIPELTLNVTGGVDPREGVNASSRSKLAEQRAKAAIAAFTAAGIDPTRLRPRTAAEFAQIRDESPDIVRQQLSVPGVVVYGDGASRTTIQKYDVDCQPGTLASIRFSVAELGQKAADDADQSVSIRFCEEARCAQASFAYASLPRGAKAALSLRGALAAGVLVSSEDDQVHIEARSVSTTADLTEGRRWSLRVAQAGRELARVEAQAHYLPTPAYPGADASCPQFQFPDETR